MNDESTARYLRNNFGSQDPYYTLLFDINRQNELDKVYDIYKVYEMDKV